MILVDTSIWADHLRHSDKDLEGLLDGGRVLTHPFIIGELALGHLKPRDAVLRALEDLPLARVASDREVLHLIDCHALFGLGIGYVDAHLLAAARLTEGAAIWTRDKQLARVAGRLDLAAQPARKARS